LGQLFAASLPQYVPGSLNPPDGTGRVQIGDGGMMTVAQANNANGAPMLCACDEAAVGIIFYSTGYGSDAFVDVQAKLPNESFPVVDRFGNVVERATGINISATINGQLAVGNGSVASMNTTELDLAIWINPDVREGDVTGFRIICGGALMQLGPDVDPSQQVRIAFQSVYTPNIGGPSGTLSQLRYGSDKDMLTDTKGAYRIVEESIQQISMFRGRLGSFQKYEVSRNLDQLEDLIAVASTMHSEIRDTDYAAETSSMAKNQLMMEAIVSVIKKPTDNMRMLIQLLNR
jgi:flagellin